MASWSNTANADMKTLSAHFTDAQVNQLRVDAGKWADVIGTAKTKRFKIGNYQVDVSAEKHVVTHLVMAV